MVECFCVFKKGDLIFMSQNEDQAMSKFRSKSGDNFARIQDLKQLESMLTNLRYEQVRINRQAQESEDTTNDEFLEDLENSDEEEMQQIVESVFDGVSSAMNSACTKLRDLGFTEENLDATTNKVKKGGQKIAAEVKSMGLRGAEILSAQLKEFTTVVDDALVELADKEEPNTPDVSEEADDDGSLPYSRNG